MEKLLVRCKSVTLASADIYKSKNAINNNKRFNYHVGRGYYVSIIYEIRDVSDFDKGNADILILYVHL
jgi:hypothetical protein